MNRKDLHRLFKETPCVEPVINLKRSNNSLERIYGKKHRRHQRSESSTNEKSPQPKPQPQSSNRISDKVKSELGSELVNEFKDNESNKFHLESSHSYENPLADKISTPNPSLHESGSYKYKTSNSSTWIPNTIHPSSLSSHCNSGQTLPRYTLLREPDEFDQYLSDDSQDNRLLPDIDSPIYTHQYSTNHMKTRRKSLDFLNHV
ncbi:unnamed protein product [Heterobilharzia americana]|nr:unnamed protein product [Heterobilharzia americana]